MQALSQKFSPLWAARSLPMGTNDLRAEVTIMRKAGQQWDKIAASEDFDVQPGDVIDVALRPSATASTTN